MLDYSDTEHLYLKESARMPEKVVAMAVIPGFFKRANVVRSDLRYAKYAKATWEWWCNQNRFHFIVLDKPLGGRLFEGISPTIQRWLAPELLANEYGSGTKVAMVDADTMIRWDTPDFFEIADSQLSAVRASLPHWIYQSIRAYQHLFPSVSLPWWEYFNSGMVIMDEGQLSLIKAFTEFSAKCWVDLHAVQLAGDFGTDQTPLNFFVRSMGEPVHYIPPTFNLLHCFPVDFLRYDLSRYAENDVQSVIAKICMRPGMFDFVNMGYIWHFSNVVTYRHVVMEQTWIRVCTNYPGANLEQ